MVQKNISEENKNFVMVRFRLPKHVYRELAINAAEHDTTVTRLMIEILRVGAERRMEKRMAELRKSMESEWDGVEDFK